MRRVEEREIPLVLQRVEILEEVATCARHFLAELVALQLALKRLDENTDAMNEDEE